MTSSIKDVAKLAGTSITTVSRVLNPGMHPVNKKTRERVEAAITELNYKPNQLARALKSSCSHLIGILVGDGSDPYFAKVIRGVSKYAQEKGYITIICNTDRDPVLISKYLEVLKDYNADGVILAGGGVMNNENKEQAEKFFTDLVTNGTPIMALSQQYLDIPQIRIDDTAAAYEMTKYLISQGHERIGFVSGPQNLLTSAVRLEGYKRALEEAGLTFLPELIADGDFTFSSGEKAIQYYASLPKQPTAIFTANDQEAVGCINQLRKMDLRVPADVSVAGFDDIEYAEHVYPSLTTVRVPMEKLGKTGAEQLITAIETGEKIPDVMIVPHEIVIRNSVKKLNWK